MFDEAQQSVVSSEYIIETLSLSSFNFKEKIHNPDFEIWKYKQIDDNTGLHRAVFMNSFKIVSVLLQELQVRLGERHREAFTQFVNQKNNQGLTALHLAVLNGNMEIASLLIENKANTELLSDRELSCIHLAAQGNHPSMLVLFKEKYRMDIESVDSKGSTPLHWAAYNGSITAAEFLISWNVNINKQDTEGLTPIHIGVKANNIKMVQLLLQHGADEEISNNQHITSKALANIKKHRNIELLFKLKRKSCRLFSVSNVVQTGLNCKCVWVLYMLLILSVTSFLLGTLYLTYTTEPVVNKLCLGGILILVVINIIYYICLYNSNPGIRPKMAELSFIALITQNGADIRSYCPFCKVQRMSFTRHCVVCDKCVDYQYHHCYMLNNCIGKANRGCLRYYFILTVITLVFFSGLSGLSTYTLVVNLKFDDVNSIVLLTVSVVSDVLCLVFLFRFSLYFNTVYCFKKRRRRTIESADLNLTNEFLQESYMVIGEEDLSSENSYSPLFQMNNKEYTH